METLENESTDGRARFSTGCFLWRWFEFASHCCLAFWALVAGVSQTSELQDSEFRNHYGAIYGFACAVFALDSLEYAVHWSLVQLPMLTWLRNEPVEAAAHLVAVHDSIRRFVLYVGRVVRLSSLLLLSVFAPDLSKQPETHPVLLLAAYQLFWPVLVFVGAVLLLATRRPSENARDVEIASAEPIGDLRTLSFAQRLANALRRARRGPPSPEDIERVAPSFALLDATNAPGDCSCCLETIRFEQTMRAMPKCGHVFHAACIDRWIAVKAECPNCRGRLFDDDRVANNDNAVE